MRLINLVAIVLATIIILFVIYAACSRGGITGGQSGVTPVAEAPKTP